MAAKIESYLSDVAISKDIAISNSTADKISGSDGIVITDSQLHKFNSLLNTDEIVSLFKDGKIELCADTISTGLLYHLSHESAYPEYLSKISDRLLLNNGEALPLLTDNHQKLWAEVSNSIHRTIIPYITDKIPYLIDVEKVNQYLLSKYPNDIAHTNYNRNSQPQRSCILLLSFLSGHQQTPSFESKSSQNYYKNVISFIEGIAEGVYNATKNDHFKEYIKLMILGLSPAGILVGLPCFLSGLVYQIYQDIKDFLSLFLHPLESIEGFYEAASTIFSKMYSFYTSLYNSDQAEMFNEFGRELGFTLYEAFIDIIVVSSPTSTIKEVVANFVQLQFNLGKIIGPILLDILISLTGVGIFEVAMKYGAKVMSIIKKFMDFLRKIFGDSIDQLADFGRKLSQKTISSLKELSDKEKLTSFGFTENQIENIQWFIETALGVGDNQSGLDPKLVDKITYKITCG